MSKWISTEKLSDTLMLQTYSDGLYLWDDTRKVNIAMYKKIEREAFVYALHYYQRRLKEVEEKYAILSTKVNHFLEQFPEDD